MAVRIKGVNMAALVAVKFPLLISLRSGVVNWLNAASDKKIKILIDFLRIWSIIHHEQNPTSNWRSGKRKRLGRD